MLLYMISTISNYHNHSYCFYNKIEKAILYFKDEIKKYISNSEISNIFKRNKRIILFLIEEQLIKIDESVLDIFIHELINDNNYIQFVIPDISTKNIDNFENNRKIGENDSYICKLIREDMIEEFIIYINKTDGSLHQNINKSFYETNLIHFPLSLIEYAAFFGSVQIFKYLYLNDVELKNSIWFYAIHGDNPEIIHIIEEKYIKQTSSNECLKESIKCHHNDLACYIKNNYLDENENIDIKQILKYYHFTFLKIDSAKIEFLIPYLIEYDYLPVVKILIDENIIGINNIMIKILQFNEI